MNIKKMREYKPEDTRKNNLLLILNKFMESDILIISDLMRTFNLSKTTLLKVVKQLLDLNLIKEMGMGESTLEGGRPPQMYSLNKEHIYFATANFTPNEIYTTISNLKGEIVASLSTEITPKIQYENFISIIKSFVLELIESQGICLNDLYGVAVGSYGLTDPIEGTTSLNRFFPNWNEKVYLKDDLAKVFPENLQIIVDNHIRFQVFAELKHTQNQKYSNVVVIESATGVVAGIVMNGKLTQGKNSLSGEIGHIIVSPNSEEKCVCGANGCLEAMISPERIVRIAYENQNKYPNSALFSNNIEVTIESILENANNDDPLCKMLVNEVAIWLNTGIAITVLTCDPDVIIIQGTYSKGGKYLKQALSECTQFVSPIVSKNEIVTIKLSTLGKDACAIGATSQLIRAFLTQKTNL